METMILPVRGMTCGGCARSVTQVLSSLPGVARVEVALEKNCAQVDYDAAKVGRQDLVTAVKAAGFDSE